MAFWPLCFGTGSVCSCPSPRVVLLLMVYGLQCGSEGEPDPQMQPGTRNAKVGTFLTLTLHKLQQLRKTAGKNKGETIRFDQRFAALLQCCFS